VTILAVVGDKAATGVRAPIGWEPIVRQLLIVPSSVLPSVKDNWIAMTTLPSFQRVDAPLLNVRLIEERTRRPDETPRPEALREAKL
jgi:hypothetical protein